MFVNFLVHIFTGRRYFLQEKASTPAAPAPRDGLQGVISQEAAPKTLSSMNNYGEVCYNAISIMQYATLKTVLALHLP